MNGELPKGWALVRLRDIADINPRHPKTINDTTFVSFAPMAAISDSNPQFNYLEERAFGKVRQGFTHFADGDVLFAKITPCMENGKGAVANGLRNGLGCGTTELIVIRPLAGIDPHYIYRFLAQRTVRSEAEDHFTSTAGQARVPTSFIQELTLPLAPIAEQRRIGARLEELIAKVNGSLQRLDHAQQMLDRFRQSVLAAACSGRLTADWRDENSDAGGASALVRRIESNRRNRDSLSSSVEILSGEERPDEEIPDTWLWTRFGTVIGELRNGVSPRPRIEPPGTPILRISAVRPGGVNLSDVRYMPHAAGFVPAFTLRNRDLLFTRYNGSVELLGVCGMVRGLGAKTVLYPDKLMRARFDHPFVLPEYAEVFFQASRVHERIVAKAKSSAGQNGVSGSDIKAQHFALPPQAEQKEIVKRVAALFALSRTIEERLIVVRTRTDAMIPTLLAKAFSGELVPTEAALAHQDGRGYESASELLRRIKSKEVQSLELSTRENSRSAKVIATGRQRRKVG